MAKIRLELSGYMHRMNSDENETIMQKHAGALRLLAHSIFVDDLADARM